MKNITKLFFAAAFLTAGMASAQTGGVGVGTTTPDASSALDVTSTTKGFLMPRMTTAQRTAIASPANGLQVYDITTNSQWYFNGTLWVEGVSNSSTWSTNGNAGTTAGTNFIGTTDDVDVTFKRNGVLSGLISVMGIEAYDSKTFGNTVLGVEAFNSTATGRSNVAIGNAALNSGTTVNWTVAIGDRALKNVTTGQANTAVGQASMENATTGDGNTAIGSSSGLNITTGNYNIMIGYGTYAQSATDSGQLNIGNTIYGVNFSHTPSGNIGIGITVPVEKLEVNGAIKIGTTTTTTPTAGTIRFNTTTSKFEGYDGTAWVEFH